MPSKQPAAPVKSHSAEIPPGTSKPAPSKSPVANAAFPPALKLADVEAMSQSDRIALFQAKDLAAGRIFIDLGKLYTGIETKLGKGEQIFPLLMKAGVRKGSVSNASQTSRVFKEMVLGKAITEEVFDTFRWGDICALNRVMSGASRKKLSAVDAAKLVAANPKRFDEDLESVFLTGHTMAVADKLAKAEAEREKEEQEANAAAEKKAAAEKAVQEALAAKAAADKKKADEQAAVAAAAKKKADEAAAAAKTADEKKKAEAAQKQADAAATNAAAAQAKAADDAKAAGAPPPQPDKGKITPMPPQSSVTLTTVGDQLDKLLENLSKLPVPQQVIFYTTTWKAAESLLNDALKGHLKKAS